MREHASFYLQLLAMAKKHINLEQVRGSSTRGVGM